MAIVYLIPSPLEEDEVSVIPAYLLDAIRDCQVFFAENERTARRFFKKLWKVQRPSEQIIIDDYKWFTINEATREHFRELVKTGINIGVISEAGCPGVADPGQELVKIAHQLNIQVKPLVGPSSILLALMASGMNGQHFQFWGYLPIQVNDRMKKIKELESQSTISNITQVFIETPYRNDQMLETILRSCNPTTLLCVAVDITGPEEMIKTMAIGEWKKAQPSLHKRPAIFLLLAGKQL
jgi:16S rRNA (cytidine1402-2'-O)-methyltransferase